MAPEPDTPMPTPQGRLFYARTFAIVALAVLGYLMFLISAPFLAPLAWASIIAFLTLPLYRKLLKRMPERENIASMILTSATLVFLIAPLLTLLAAFSVQATELLRAIKGATGGDNVRFLDRADDLPVIPYILEWLESNFAVSAREVETWISNNISRLLETLLEIGGKLVLGAVGTATGFLIMIFVLFFITRDGERILAGVKALVPMSSNRTDRLFEHLGEVTRAVVLGTVVTALVQGVLVGLALAALGIPAPVVFGAVAAVLALLPVGGPAILWIPVCLVLIIDDRWLAASGLALWGILLVGTIDNILRPLIVSSRGHVGTLLAFIGVLGGAAAFGMIGILVGPVVLALGVALQRFAVEMRQSPAGAASA